MLVHVTYTLSIVVLLVLEQLHSYKHSAFMLPTDVNVWTYVCRVIDIYINAPTARST